MGVGPGDQVVVPAFTSYASAEAIPPTGARPVFCDVDPETMMLTADMVRPPLTSKTKAVIAVHLFGNVAPIREIEALGVPVLEDAAQAAGSRGPDGRPGALGTAATFSFFPSKNLGCLGDRGAITTDEDRLAEQARAPRFHGSHDQTTWEYVGYNSRLDAIQAAFLRVLLPTLTAGPTRDEPQACTTPPTDWARMYRRLLRPQGLSPLGICTSFVRRRSTASPRASRASRSATRCTTDPRFTGHPAMIPYAPATPLTETDHLADTHLATPISPALTGDHAREVTECMAAALG